MEIVRSNYLFKMRIRDHAREIPYWTKNQPEDAILDQTCLSVVRERISTLILELQGSTIFIVEC